jgi:cysteine-rich repeat protein
LILNFTIAKLAGSTGAVVWRRGYDAIDPRTATAFFAHALVTTSSGDVVAAGSRTITPTSAPTHTFTVQKMDSATGALLVCGDGYVDPGETCDPGDPVSVDCCSPTCQPTSEGSSCSDGNECTGDEACAQGRCVGTPILCEPCGTCDPVNGCTAHYASACKVPTASNAAALRLVNRPGRRHDGFRWQWTSGMATSKKDFGHPRASTGYAICVYEDDSSAATPVLLRAVADPGQACSRKKGCWRSAPNGFEYRSKSGSPDGVRRISLRAGSDGRASIVVAGGGPHVAVPALPLPPSVTVQVRQLGDGFACWVARHDLIVKNRTDLFVGKGN